MATSTRFIGFLQTCSNMMWQSLESEVVGHIISSVLKTIKAPRVMASSKRLFSYLKHKSASERARNCTVTVKYITDIVRLNICRPYEGNSKHK